MKYEKICPVCGKTSQVHQDDIRCPHCGFSTAFVRQFSGRRTCQAWKKQVSRAREAYMEQVNRRFREEYTVAVGRGITAVHGPSRKGFAFRGNGKPETLENVRCWHIGERHEVVVHTDGTVTASGSNEFGQCNTKQLRNIRFAVADARCTYAVTEGGTVEVVGASSLREQMTRWQGVVSLSCGPYHVVGLTDKGRVMIAMDGGVTRELQEVSKWTDVASVVTGANSVLALRRDGRVLFAGDPEDPRAKAAGWSDIISIGLDSQYAVGVTSGGEVKLEGTCHKLLDMGRAEAAKWKNAALTACGRSCIAVVHKNGSLSLAGSIPGRDAMRKAWDCQMTADPA